MRPRHIPAFAYAALAVSFMVSCSSPSGPSDEDGTDAGSSVIFGNEWWGSWNGMHRWHFTDKSLTITINPDSDFPTVRNPTIRRLNPEESSGEYMIQGQIFSSWEEETYVLDMIEPTIMRVTNYTNSNVLFQKSYLMRDGELQEPFTGKVLTNVAPASRSASALGDGSRALRPPAGISLTIQNVLNASVPLYSASVGAGGGFESQKFIPGDEYRITASAAVGKPFSLSIVPSDGGLDIGNLVVGEVGYNLKCGIELTGIRSSFNSNTRNSFGFPYPGQWYSGSVIIQKIGDAAGPALDWSLESPDGDLSISTAVSGHLGGIVASAEAYSDIPIMLRTDSSSLADYVDRRLRVSVTDAAGLSWDDLISIRFYSDRIFLEQEGVGSFIIVTPEGQSISGVSGGFILPYREEGYLIWLLPTNEAATQFSIGVNREALASDPQVDCSSAIDREHAIDIAYGDAIRSSRPVGASRWFHITPTATSTYVRDFERTVVTATPWNEISSVAITLSPVGIPLIAYCMDNKVHIAELEGETWRDTTPSGGFRVGVSSPELSISFDGSGTPVVAGRSGSVWDGVVLAWKRGDDGTWTQYGTEYTSSDLCLTPSVVTDDSGESILVWMGGEGIRTARIPISGTTLTPETLNVRGYYAETGGIGIGRPFTIFDSLGTAFLFRGLTVADGQAFFSVRPGEAPIIMANTRYNETDALIEIFEGVDGVIRILRTTGISALRPDGRGYYEDVATKSSFSAPYGAYSAKAVADEAGTVHIVYSAVQTEGADRPDWLRYARGSEGIWQSQVVDYSEKAVMNTTTILPHKIHAIAVGPNPSGEGEIVWIPYWIYRSALMVARLEVGTRF